MNREILDHAGLILGREATRTLGARALHQRTTAALGIEFSYAHFLQLLGTRPDRFTIVTERTPLADRWTVADADQLAAQLEHAGVLRSPTVVRADLPPRDETHGNALDDVAGALAATLADAHAAVVELLALEHAADVMGGSALGAVLELDELRSACAAQLRTRKKA